MGFDIVLFDQDHCSIGLLELPQDLHRALFAEPAYWKSYKLLRQLRDYYLTDVTWQASELKQFVFELEQFVTFINLEYRVALQNLIIALSNDSIKQVHIAGD